MKKALPSFPAETLPDHADAGPLEPEAVALMAEVLNAEARLGVFAGTRGANGDIADEAADLVADFRDKGGAVHVVGHVVDHIDIAAVVDESPAGAVHHGAARHGRGVAVVT